MCRLSVAQARQTHSLINMYVPKFRVQHLLEPSAPSPPETDLSWLRQIIFSLAWPTVASHLWALGCLVSFLRQRLVHRRPDPSSSAATIHACKLEFPAKVFKIQLLLRDRAPSKLILFVANFKVTLTLGERWWKPQLKVTSCGMVKCSTAIKSQTPKNKQKVGYKDASTQTGD